MTLEELLELQQHWGLGDVHIVDLQETSFNLAHTNAERAHGENNRQCRIHAWLASHGGPPKPVGLYTITTHEPDGYSESYRSEPWQLHPIQKVTDYEPPR